MYIWAYAAVPIGDSHGPGIPPPEVTVFMVGSRGAVPGPPGADVAGHHDSGWLGELASYTPLLLYVDLRQNAFHMSYPSLDITIHLLVNILLGQRRVNAMTRSLGR